MNLTRTRAGKNWLYFVGDNKDRRSATDYRFACVLVDAPEHLTDIHCHPETGVELRKAGFVETKILSAESGPTGDHAWSYLCPAWFNEDTGEYFYRPGKGEGNNYGWDEPTLPLPHVENVSFYVEGETGVAVSYHTRRDLALKKATDVMGRNLATRITILELTEEEE